MDVLCVDKRGTLTQNKITLVKYIDVNGKEDEKVLLYSYLNASYRTGMKKPLNEAIIEYRKVDISNFKKIDEIPFDYVRRRVSVAVEESNKKILISKGAFESIISICEKAVIDGNEIEISEEVRKKIENTYREISSQGFRVLGLAIKEVEAKDLYNKEDEKEMTFFGLIAFYDLPKESAKEAIKLIEESCIEIKILTADDEFVTRKVCEVLSFKIKEKIIHWEEITKMTDEALERVVEKSNVFVRLTPTQKIELLML